MKSTTASSPSADGDPIAQMLAQARSRWRREAVVRVLGVTAWVAAGAILAFTASLLVVPKLALAFPLFLGVLLTGVALAALVAYVKPVPEKRVWMKVDACGGLHDSVLTAQELQAAELPPGWATAQRAKAVAGVNWEAIRAAWPVRFTSTTARVTLCCALALMALQFAYATYTPPLAELLTAKTMSEQAKALEEIRKDWEQALEEQKENETLKKALAELKPLQERVAKGEMTEKELLVEMSKLEDKLTAMQAEQKAETMSPSMAKEMAEAMNEMEGTGALAAALQRNDMEKAEKQAGETAKKWDQEGAKALDKPLSESAQQQLSKLAQQAEGQKMQQMANGLKQLSQGGQKNDSKQMANGMRQMQQSLQKQSQSQSQCKSLANQLKQLSACKNCMGNGMNPSMALSMMPSLCQGTKPGGKNAGKSTDPNVLGAPTDMAATLKQENLQGTMGAGESEITTEKTTTPTPAQVAAGTAVSFDAYEKLSQAAIEDESLPLAHREAIKKYFETIRPKDAPQR